MGEEFTGAAVDTSTTQEANTATVDTVDIAAEERKIIAQHAKEMGKAAVAKRVSAPAVAANEKPVDGEKPSASEKVSADDEKPADKKPTITASAHSFEDLKAMASEGKFDEVWEALGFDPKGMAIPAQRFAEFRQLQKRHAAQQQHAQRQLASERAAIQQQLADAVAKFGPLEEARKALEAGDVVGALEAFAGEPLDKVTEKAMRQKLASDPRTSQLERELNELKREKKAQLEAEQKATAERATQAQVSQYLGQVKDAFMAGEDPVFAVLAEGDPEFPQAVYRIQLAAAQKEGVELSAEEAAHRLIAKVKPSAILWAKALGFVQEADSSNRPAKQAANTARTGTSTGKPGTKSSTAAKRATPKSEYEMTEQELLQHLQENLGSENPTW